MIKKICIMFIAGILLTGCTIGNKEDATIKTTSSPAVKNEGNEIEEKKIEETDSKNIELKGTFRYVSKVF